MSRRKASERDHGTSSDPDELEERNERLLRQRLSSPPEIPNAQTSPTLAEQQRRDLRAQIDEAESVFRITAARLNSIRDNMDRVRENANQEMVDLRQLILDYDKRQQDLEKQQRQLRARRTECAPQYYQRLEQQLQGAYKDALDNRSNAQHELITIERRKAEILQRLTTDAEQQQIELKRARRRLKHLTADKAARRSQLDRQQVRSEQVRANQTEEERRVRLDRQRVISEQVRANQTEEERRVRLDRQRVISDQNRFQRTPAQQQRFLEYDRLYRRAKRIKERESRDIASGGTSNFEHDIDASLAMIAGQSGNVEVARLIELISAAVAQRQYVDHLQEQRTFILNSDPYFDATEYEHALLDHENIAHERREQENMELKAKQQLTRFIRESTPSDERAKELIRECMFALGTGRALYICGSCGIRQLPSEREYAMLPLVDCHKFQYTAQERQRFDDQNLFLRLVKSSYCEAEAEPDNSPYIAATQAYDESPHTRMEDEDFDEARLEAEHTAQQQRYHLHPEAMTRNTSTNTIHTRLCPTCFTYATMPEKVPKLCIKSGHDYGYWKRALRHPSVREDLRNMEPTSIEELCATVVRLYQHVYMLMPTQNGIVRQQLRMGDNEINIRQLAMKAHVVTFAHDAAAQASELIARRPNDLDEHGRSLMRPLLADGVRERIKVKFFAPSGMQNQLRLAGMNIPDLRSEADKVEQLITIFSHCNPEYQRCIQQAYSNNNVLSDEDRAAIANLQESLINDALNEANPNNIEGVRDDGFAMLMHREHNEHVSERPAPGAVDQSALEQFHHMKRLRDVVQNVAERVVNHNETAQDAEELLARHVANVLHARTEVEDVLLTSRHNIRTVDRISNIHNEVAALQEAMRPPDDAAPEPAGRSLAPAPAPAVDPVRPPSAELRTHHDSSNRPGGGGGSTMTAMNEFTENRRLLWGSHPLVFPLGYVNSKEGPLSPAVIKHLLRQFTNVAASHPRLLFLLHNQKDRHNVSKAANVKVRNDPESLNWFRRSVFDQVFQNRLQQVVDSMARRDRTEAEVAQSEREMRAILKEVNPHIYSAGRFSNTSSFDKRSGMAQFYAMSQLYGKPAIFLTFSVDDTVAGTCVKFATSCANNESFPVQEENLMNMLRRGAHFESSGGNPAGGGDEGNDNAGIDGGGELRNIDFSLAGLSKLVASHPVASTIYFMELKTAILKLILGNDSMLNSKKTTSYAEREPGILGKIDTYFGAIEAQGRGSLHGHFVFWIPALSPLLFDAVSAVEQLKEVMYRVVQGICVTEATNEKHIIAVLAKRKLLPADVISHSNIIASVTEDYEERGDLTLGFLLRPSLQPAINLDNDENFLRNVKSYGENVALNSNMHVHMGTCNKSLLGHTRCRLCLPRNLCPNCRFVQLCSAPIQRTHQQTTSGGDSKVEAEHHPPPFVSFDEFQDHRYRRAAENNLMLPNKSPIQKLPRNVPFATDQIDPKVGFQDKVTAEEPMPFGQTSSLLSSGGTNNTAGTANNNNHVLKTVIFEQERKEITKVQLEEAAQKLLNHRCRQQQQPTVIAESRSTATAAAAADDDSAMEEDIPPPPAVESIQNAAGRVMLEILGRCGGPEETAMDREVLTELFYRNGYLVEHNPIIAACCKANTNLQLLGTDVQAKNVLMYLIKYLCKDGAPIQNTVAIICQAFKHSQRYAHREIPVNMTNPRDRRPTAPEEDDNVVHPQQQPPQGPGGAAPPAPIPEDHAPRECVHFIANILNQMNGIAEIGGCMAAYILFDNKVIETPEKFQYVFPTDATSYSERNYDNSLSPEQRQQRQHPLTDAQEFYFDILPPPAANRMATDDDEEEEEDEQELDDAYFLHDGVLREIFNDESYDDENYNFEDNVSNYLSSILGDDDDDDDDGGGGGRGVDVVDDDDNNLLLNQQSARVAAAADLAVVEDDNNNVNILDRVGLADAFGADDRVYEGGTSSAHVSNKRGNLPIYIIDNPARPNERIKVAISMESLYAARGEKLQHFCYDTWAQVVQIVARDTANDEEKKDDDGGGGGNDRNNPADNLRRAGRPPNLRIVLDTWHPLHASHVQQLRSKYPINIYSGPRPPQYPGHRPPLNSNGRLPEKWKRSMRAVAKFVLVMFKPWQRGRSETDATAGPLTYREFVHFMAFLLEESRNSNYHMHLLLKIQHILCGLNCNNRLQQMQSDYRNMSCDFWKEPPPWWVMKQEIMNRERNAAGNNNRAHGDEFNVDDPYEEIIAVSDEMLLFAREQLARANLANNPKILGTSQTQRDARLAAEERFQQDCEDLILLPGLLPSRFQRPDRPLPDIPQQTARVLETTRQDVRTNFQIDRLTIVDNSRNAFLTAQRLYDGIRRVTPSTDPAALAAAALASEYHIAAPPQNNNTTSPQQQQLAIRLQEITLLSDAQRKELLRVNIRTATTYLDRVGIETMMDENYNILEHPLMSQDENILLLYSKLNDGQRILVRSFLLYVLINWMVYGVGMQSESKQERQQRGQLPPELTGNDNLRKLYLQLLLLAGPGFGKTFLMQTVHKILIFLYTRGVCSSAYTGIASSLLPNGQTLHSYLGLGRKGRKPGDIISDDKLLFLIELTNDCPFVVIDEVSMVGKNMLMNLHEIIDEAIRLQNETRHGIIRNQQQQRQTSTVFFGGMSMILTGDFHQIIPVGEQALYKTVVRVGRSDILKQNVDVSPQDRTAYAILTSFTRVTLNKQVRAENDASHTKCLEAMRSWDPQYDNQPRISDTVIQRLQQRTLTPREYNSDPHWKDAPFLVSGNTERVTLNSLCTERFAALHGLPIISWPLEASVKIQKNYRAAGENAESYNIQRLSPEEREDLIRNNLTKVEFSFVKHAPALLTNNICTHLGLCNGTKVYMHSLIIKAEDVGGNYELQTIKSRISNGARSGERIVLPTPPAFINVIVLKQDNSVEDETKFRNKWQGHFGNTVRFTSEINGTLGVIVPIPRLQTTSDYDEYRAALTDNLIFLENKIKVKPSHDVVPAFAFTFHKCQGQTIYRAIIFLHPHLNPPITFHSLFTVLSRVPGLDFLRIAPFFNILRRTVFPDSSSLGGETSEHMSLDVEEPYEELKWLTPDLSFLQDLQPDPDLLLFMRSYDENGHWSADLFRENANRVQHNISKQTSRRREDSTTTAAAAVATVLATTTRPAYDDSLVTTRRQQQASSSRQSVVSAATPLQQLGQAAGHRRSTGNNVDLASMLARTEAAMSTLNLGQRTNSTAPGRQSAVPILSGVQQHQRSTAATQPIVQQPVSRTSDEEKVPQQDIANVTHSYVYMYILARVYGLEHEFPQQYIQPSEILSKKEWKIIENAHRDDLQRRGLQNPFIRQINGAYRYNYLHNRIQERYILGDNIKGYFDDDLYFDLPPEANPLVLREEACRRYAKLAIERGVEW